MPRTGLLFLLQFLSLNRTLVTILQRWNTVYFLLFKHRFSFNGNKSMVIKTRPGKWKQYDQFKEYQCLLKHNVFTWYMSWLVVQLKFVAGTHSMACSRGYAWYPTGSSVKGAEVLWIGEMTSVYPQMVTGATHIHVSNNPLQLQNWKGLKVLIKGAKNNSCAKKYKL